MHTDYVLNFQKHFTLLKLVDYVRKMQQKVCELCSFFATQTQ